MAHHHRDTDKQVTAEKARHRRHSHHDHSHLRASSVIDHLKTKVKRSRLSKHGSAELSDATSISNQSENIVNNSQAVELQHHRSTTSVDSHPAVLSTIFSYDGNDDTEVHVNNDVFVEKNKEKSFAPGTIDSENEVEDTVQWRANPSIPDTSVCRLNSKLVKATKSLPEFNNPTIPKKRRQTLRRTGFQIRDDDFSTIFSDLPSDEQLIIGFPCAWRKDVFMHGRMFLSVNHLCFYTCFFKWEESLCIAYKDIISVTREKSVRLLPNAIKIRTKNLEQYFFASTLPRERIFIAIFRLWQNALLEQPLDYQRLRAVIFADQQQSVDESSEESEESTNVEHPPESAHYSQSLPVASNRSSDPTLQPIRINRRVVSLQPESNTDTYLSSCPCENHLAKSYVDRMFTLSVDTLFEFLFGDNSFTRNFHTAQKLTDYHYGEWRLNKETGHRERQVTYKTIAQSILGSNSLSCREKQTLEVEKSRSIYVLSSEVYNEGMKYTDAFYVATRFCMIQRDAQHSSLRATAEVRYIKNVNSIIKSFIEKNAYSSIEDGINEQVRRLENRQVNVKSNHSKRHRRKSSNNDQIQDHSTTSSQSNISIKEKPVTRRGTSYNIALFVGIFLVLLHIYLCYKLYSLDDSIPTPETICINRCVETCSGKQPN